MAHVSEPADDRQAGSPARPPLSALAVTALVLALVPCCPMTGLLGAFLGLAALRRTGGPAARARGRRLALAAVVAGTVSAVGWSAAWDRFGRAQEDAQDEAIVSAVTTMLEAASTGRAGDARALFSTENGRRPTLDEIDAFGAELVARYGAFEGMDVISTARTGSIFAPVVEVAVLFRFEDSSPAGSARLLVKVAPGRFSPVFSLARVTVEDAERGDLTVPAVTEIPAPPP